MKKVEEDGKRQRIKPDKRAYGPKVGEKKKRKSSRKNVRGQIKSASRLRKVREDVMMSVVDPECGRMNGAELTVMRS